MFLAVTICISYSANEHNNEQYYLKIMLDDEQSIITQKSWFMFSQLSQVHYPSTLEPSDGRVTKIPYYSRTAEGFGTENLSMHAYH